MEFLWDSARGKDHVGVKSNNPLTIDSAEGGRRKGRSVRLEGWGTPAALPSSAVASVYGGGTH